MNYYNPYFYTIPNMVSTPKVGLFSRLFGGNRISLSGIFNGTQKVLNFANQAIPLVKQVRPMIGNAKTMFKVMNEFKRTEKPKTNNNETAINNMSKTENTETINTTDNIQYSNNGPTFFI